MRVARVAAGWPYIELIDVVLERIPSELRVRERERRFSVGFLGVGVIFPDSLIVFTLGVLDPGTLGAALSCEWA